MSRRLFKRRGNLAIMPEVKEPKVKKEKAPKAVTEPKAKKETVIPTTEETKEETTATPEV